MKNSTLNELANFIKEEKKITEEVFGSEEMGMQEKNVSPREFVIKNILNYSQSLSIRESEYLDQIEMNLN